MQWSEYLHKSTGTKKTSFSSQLTSKQLKDQRSHQTEKSSNEGSQTFLDLMSHQNSGNPSWIKGQPKKHYASCFLKPPWLLETTKQLYTWSSGWFQNHSQHWRVAMDRWHTRTIPGYMFDQTVFFVFHSSNVYHGFGGPKVSPPHHV